LRIVLESRNSAVQQLEINPIVSSDFAQPENATTETIAPVAAAIIMGVNAEMLTSTNKTSTANNTPAMGALKAAAIPAATPQPISKVLSL
jgi:carbamoylphosphate synthase large subunit